MSSAGVGSVDTFTECLTELLNRSKRIKPSGEIEPALTSTSFDGHVERITKRVEHGTSVNTQDHYAALETACRNIFYNLLASTSIDDISFGQIWNLLDIVTILSDVLLCEPGLAFWLVEELLDSQTIDGCRVVFDYLDSRRERLIARHFKQKQLIILRACNELLRRLSRAEDTVFCGRVFILMFQSFPLGDRSSVNLRGEYHVENVTVFDEPLPKQIEDSEGAMELDQKPDEVEKGKTASDNGPAALKTEADISTSQSADAATKTVKFDAQADKPQEPEPEPDTETLYPVFWSLQDTFSQPTRLFDTQVFSTFKSGLELTLRKFKAVQQTQQSRLSNPKLPSAESPRTLKRKRSNLESDHSSKRTRPNTEPDQQHHQKQVGMSFNPRYLTSRDLFSLEISDPIFRRHILVQSLILIDFLLSLTPRSKRKLESKNPSNKSVIYPYTLNDADTTWATTTRAEIATYLQAGAEGKFYYRMVDTVLSRDKNWVHWKADSCPLISQPPVPASSVLEAQKGATRACAPRRIRPHPMGALDLSFLSNTGDEGQAQGLEALKRPERYTLPKVEDYKAPILEDEFDMEMARTEEEKEEAGTKRASKMWRALRLASKNRLNLFDRIEDGKDLGALFDPPPEEPPAKNVKVEGVEDGTKDDDTEEKEAGEEAKKSTDEVKGEMSGPTEGKIVGPTPTAIEAS
ncbi:MAG: hypothetical protein L6R39_000374 [Caloplaca ligustica]|nr:MAG: hypothetical protein L6R39_000374 [Caloplaca ligustica]